MHTHTRTIAGADALPGVLWGDVTGSGGGEMAQSFSCQSDGIHAASWRTAGAQAPVVAHPEDAEAQRVLDVRYYTYMEEFNSQRDSSSRIDQLTCSVEDVTLTLPDVHPSVLQPS